MSVRVRECVKILESLVEPRAHDARSLWVEEIVKRLLCERVVRTHVTDLTRGIHMF